MCVIKMSSSMQNFMEAYAAVHNTEAREELSSNRDLISEMDISHLTSTDLLEIAEQVLEVAFKTLTVQEAHEVITSMLSEETEIAGRANKTDRLLEGFNEAFAEVGSKAASVALEHFAQYRHTKKLQETWTARFNQEKRVARVHGRQVAEDVASVKAKLLALLEEKKGNMKAARANVGASTCWDGYKAKGTKTKNGRQVPNCVKEDEIQEKKNDGNLANNYPPYDKVTRGDIIAGATGKDQMGGKKKQKKMKESVGVAFSQKELDAFESILNSWED